MRLRVYEALAVALVALTLLVTLLPALNTAFVSPEEELLGEVLRTYTQPELYGLGSLASPACGYARREGLGRGC